MLGHQRLRRLGRRDLVVAGALGLLVVLGAVVALHAPPRDHVTGLWPVGLGTGAVVLAPRWWRLPMAALVGAIATVAVVLSEYPDDVAVGVGVATAAEVLVAALLLGRRDRRRPELRTDDDLRRYFAAAIGAAVVGGSLVALALAVGGYGQATRTALTVAVAHAASHLYLVPFFLRLPAQGAIAGHGERLLQWVVLLGGTPLLLLPATSSSLAFLVIPILAWGALRATPVEALVQLVGVVFLAVVLTSYDEGPFADVPMRYDLPADARGLVLAAFCMSCAVIVVPIMLRVGEYVGAASEASAERDLVRGIVDGAMGVAIVGTDAQGRITLFTPGAELLLGYRADEVLGRHSRLLHTREAVQDKARELGVSPSLAAVTRAMVNRRLVGSPVRTRRKDGVERTHAMTITRLSAGGETIGFVATSEDITDTLATEQALRDALDTERRAVERLRDVDAVKDQFVSTVSHELRTPITSILGYLEMLADGSLGPVEAAQLDAVLRVQSNSQRLLMLIDDLLTLSRVGEQGLLPSPGELDLRDAVRTAHDVVAPSWLDSRDLDVVLVLPDDAVVVSGNRPMLERLVVNLIGNAVKFTDDGGSVTVTLHLDDNDGDDGARAVLRVTDTGIGIPADEQDQLFTRFFRSSLAEGRAIPGSGLGLSIAQAVAEQHGGSIGVTSLAGQGTTVEVRLPVVGGAPPGMSKIQLPLDEASRPS